MSIQIALSCRKPLLELAKLSLFTLFAWSSLAFSSEQREDVLNETIAVDYVWSGHRIKPYLLTRGENQFVGYFDANRQMTVAHRVVGKPWRYYKVDSWLGWDSHNYVTLELDSAGHLHLIGNMHGDGLEYFKTSEPMVVRSLKRVPVLVDPSIEKRMTYPQFLLNKKGQLILKYRDGGSGNGNEIYNIYNTDSQSWSRLHQNTFLDGEGKMSGYFEGPTLGPDGNFHLIWVWRNTPNAATNHSLSYARSEDLINWTDSNGKAIGLPITLSRTEVVDPVPAFGGMINGNVKLGFDHKNRPVISYHKYDKNGNTQFYLARKNKSKWDVSQITEWDDFRWDFSGGGSLGRFAVEPYPPVLVDADRLSVVVRKHDTFYRYTVDSKSLKTIRYEEIDMYPPEIEAETKRSNKRLIAGAELPLEHHVFPDAGIGSDASMKFFLSWYSQPGNRDRAHSFISSPSVLLVHGINSGE